MYVINRDKAASRSLRVYIHWFLVLVYAVALMLNFAVIISNEKNRGINLIKLAVIFGGILIIWIFLSRRRSKKFFNKTLKTYELANENLEFDFNDFRTRLKIDENEESFYVFENDNIGNIIKLPFNKILSYRIYEDYFFGKGDYFTRIIEIKTSLEDPNLSIIKLYYNEGDVQDVEEARKLLVYAIGRNKENSK